MIYILLFFEFFKIGLFSFGGGLAMLPLIQNVVLKHHWISEPEFLDIIAISQITPGPIAINASTFVGNKVAGIFGAFIATFACALPSFLVIIFISYILKNIKNRYKNAFFDGVKPVILALISFAGIIIGKSLLQNGYKNSLKAILLSILVFLGIKYSKLNPIFFLLLSGILGIFIF